jgi:tRNA (cytidine32/uridine32-2'-O)-methyltransferase
MSQARIRFVLVATSHPGNIGATARAMKTMGLHELVLVAPRVFPSEEASALAAGADDLLARARVVDTLAEAIADCRTVYGLTPKRRTVPLPEYTPRDAAPRALAETAAGDVAFVFGTERIGLTNAEVERCHATVNIPANPEFDSLNLAQAVQVMAYELRLAGGASLPPAAAAADTADEQPADAAQLERFFAHLGDTLYEIDFLKGRPAHTVLRRLRRLFLRARPSAREVATLRGVFAEAQRCAQLAGIAPRGTRPSAHTGGAADD